MHLYEMPVTGGGSSLHASANRGTSVFRSVYNNLLFVFYLLFVFLGEKCKQELNSLGE